MTPTPRPELATLMLPMADAEDLAAKGNAADDYPAVLEDDSRSSAAGIGPTMAAMIQVIDRIRGDAILADRWGRQDAEGLWLILDPAQTRGLSLPVVGQPVTIEKPDGSSVRVPLDGAWAPHGVIGLHFRHLDAEAIPRLSRVSWALATPAA